MRVLVTGGAGFLGHEVCRQLEGRGHEPVSLDLQTRGTGWREITGSVLDPETWERAGKLDAVVHAAALTDLWRRRPTDFAEVNVGGNCAAASFAKKFGARFVLISSYTSQAALQAPPVIDEGFVPPKSLLFGPYARSKRAAEEAARAILPGAVVLRPSALIGPNDRGPTPPMRMLLSAASGSLPGMVNGRIDLLDVRDAAACVLAGLERGEGDYLVTGHDVGLPEVVGLAANMAGAKPPGLSVPGPVALMAARVEETLGTLTGRRPEAVREGVRMAMMKSRFSSARAAKELGHHPRPLERSLEDALRFLEHRTAS